MAWWMAAAAVGQAWAKSEADKKSAKARGKYLDQAARDKIKAADSLLYASVINRSLAESRGRETQSAQIASYASSGVDISSGSALDTLANTQTQILRNDFLTKYKAEAEADLLRSQGQQYQEEASLAKKNAKNRDLQNIVQGGLQAASAYYG